MSTRFIGNYPSECNFQTSARAYSNKQQCKGPYIKYVRGGPEGFCGAMKYFRHILMGHERFFKIFDGPRNNFLYSVFLILFFNLRGLQHKISKLAIKEI